MGAVLGCYSGPEPDLDALLATRALYSVHGAKQQQQRQQQRQQLRRSGSYAKPQTPTLPVDASVLGKLQRTLSLSLLRSRVEASGSEKKDSVGRDDDSELLRSYSQSHSSASGATSGSRLLSDFYNLVLESERNTFFKDKHGKRVTGAYLDDVRIIDDYFGASARKRPRTLVGRPSAEPPKLPILERFAHLPTALMSTTSTMSSEMDDYWSCLDSLTLDPDELEKAPRRYDSATGLLLLLSPVHSTPGRVATSLSPPSRWPDFGSLQFNEADDDDDDDDDDEQDGSCRSAGASMHEQLQRTDADRYPSFPKQLVSSPATGSGRALPIYSKSRSAVDTVAPMIAS